MKTVYILMESFEREFHDNHSMGYVICVSDSLEELRNIARDLREFIAKNSPDDYYVNWIVERIYFIHE